VLERLRQGGAVLERCVRRMSRKRVGVFLLVLEVIVLYGLYGWHPFVIQTWASVDDGLYVQQAMGFLDGLAGKSESWLGGYHCFLLSTVPLYGLWLAFLHLLGIPLRVGDFLLLLASAWLFRRAVKPVRALRSWEFGVVLFLLLANPFINMDFCLRRFTLHTALTNLCLVALLGLLLRAQASMASRARWALLAGLGYALCHLNREESGWLWAVFLVAGAILWLCAFLAWRRGEIRGRQALLGQAALVLALLAGVLPPILTVCTLNLRSYGVFMTAFRHSSAMTDLVQRLTSLEPAKHQAYIPIARATRFRAYELSSSFARLKPFLDGRSGYWRAGNPEQAVSNGHKPEEGEVFVSYFEFCLLWAAEQAGAKRAYQAVDLFRAIEHELDQAVRDGKIEAGASGFASLAAPVPGDYRRMARAFWTALSSLVTIGTAGYVWPAATAPQGSRAQIEEAGQLTQSWVKPEPLPNLRYSVREPVVRRCKQVQMVAFPLLIAAMPVLVLWRRREVFTRSPSIRGILLLSFAVPATAVLAFCAAMAVLEVTGFKFLATMGYAVLGYSPLTVLCALSFVGLLVLSRKPPSTPTPARGAAPHAQST
jgi:hypothetical protein